MVELVLTRGLPGSGKTTWARTWVEEDPSRRVRVNRDDLRMAAYGRYSGLGALENRVTLLQHAAAEAALRDGCDVVVDDTNLAAKTVRSWYEVATRTGAQVRFQDFSTPVEECLRRNALREKSVDVGVIESFAARYLRGGRLPTVPDRTAAPARAPQPYVPDRDKPRVWLCDLDGTYFHMLERGPYDWDRVGEDAVDESVARLVQLIQECELGDDNHPDRVVFMSGRDSSCRAQTEDALRRAGVRDVTLLMRSAGDMRRDSVVKLELFDRYVRDRYWVQAVLDDRDQVVQMWRALGVPCYQVAPGAF